MKMERRHWSSLIAALFLLAAVVWFRATLLDLIIEPIASLLWALWRVLASIDQSVLWGILVLVCAGLALRLVPFGSGLHDDEERTSQAAVGDRRAHWQSLVAAARDHEGRMALRQILGGLAQNVAEVTRTPVQSEEPATDAAFAWLIRLVPGFGRRRDWSEIDRLLTGMESALEIKHANSPDELNHD